MKTSSGYAKAAILVFLVAMLAATGAMAQTIATSTLIGKVIAEGAPLPGVTITATSPRLQGPRTVITDGQGSYLMPFLPPGQYKVTFAMDQMQTREETMTLTAAMTSTLDVDLKLAAVESEIVVTASKNLTAPIEATAVNVNFNQDLINMLPTGRSMAAVTRLAPGANDGGPGGNTIISGAMSYDSLYLINGVNVNENLRGQPHNLYIEDAIEETTVFTGSISAEYGNFTGGVVNMLTKSGGNQFKGTFRATLRNESWTSKTPLTGEQEDKINPTYEATFGGPFWRDKLWFFTAGRAVNTDTINQTSLGLARTGDQDANGVPYAVGDQIEPITYPYEEEQTRLEAKLTWAITQAHRVIGSYTDVDETQHNYRRSGSMDLRSLNPNRMLPNTLLALNYNGVITENLFLEAQYSAKEYSFLNSGSSFYDLINGTLLLDRARGTRYWSPTFRIKPGGEQRDNELWAINGTYFLSTGSAGTHEFKLGYQYFDEVRDVNNYQNGSDYRISLSQTIIRGDEIYPRVRTGGTYTRIYWYPIFVPSEGSHYSTNSVYLNDRWVVSPRWTLNLGVRYDKNDATSGDGSYKVADDSAFSPRLGANWDVLGDGKLKLTASYAQYVGRLAEGIGNDGDPAGRTASFNWVYRGPAINNSVNTPTEDLVPTDVAIQMVMDWFFENGGTDMRPTRTAPSIPGLQTILDPTGLKSPNVDEWTLGIGVALGNKGIARADFVYRTWDDFYIGNINTDTGQVDFEDRSYDQNIVGNDKTGIYNREYQGIHTQAQYRFTNRFNAGLTYTWSKLIGNVTGENTGSGPIRGTAGQYPEYREARWNYPTGYLTGDRRHRARLWGTYDLPTGIGDFNFSLMQRFESGQASSTDGTIDSRPYVDNPGYLSPVSGISYFFGGRGNLKTESITATDIGVQYTLPIKAVDLFVRFDAFNIFNEQAVDGFNEEILTEDDEDWLAAFNPFTDTPLECPQGASPETCIDMGANWQKGPNFGEPTSESSYQAPRSFRIAFGLRF